MMGLEDDGNFPANFQGPNVKLVVGVVRRIHRTWGVKGSGVKIPPKQTAGHHMTPIQTMPCQIREIPQNSPIHLLPPKLDPFNDP